MKHLKKILLTLLFGALTVGAVSARTVDGQASEKAVVFKFQPEKDIFYVRLDNNYSELKRLYELVDQYRDRIISGDMPLYVDSYCASFPDREKSRRVARVRANRVKSELIRNKGLKEEHFRTINHTVAYEGQTDIVIVMLRIPVSVQAEEPETIAEPQPKPVEEPEPAAEPQHEPDKEISPSVQVGQAVVVQPEPDEQTITLRPEQESRVAEILLRQKTSWKPSRWYVGAQAGMAFGVSSFTSFGEDRTRVGYNFGLLGGYTINKFLSAEFSAMFTHLGLGTSKCCTDYWLGADGVRYLAPVAGQENYSYRDIYSSVSMQQFGLRLNIDLVPLFSPNIRSRWSALVSPALYGVGYRPEIKTSEGRNTILKYGYRFRFGAGGDVAVGCRLNERFSLRLGTGINCVLGGGHFDGLPADNHNSNFVWNTNLTFIWHINKK